MDYLIKDIKKEERPRERLIKYGKEALSNEELLSIILKTGTKSRSVKVLAVDILNSLNSLNDLQEMTINRLLTIKGIGVVKAVEIMATVELGKRIFFTKYQNKNKWSNPLDIYQDNKYLFLGLKQECFYCLYLNNKNELIERKKLFMGTVNRSIVHPREVFKYAYLTSASSIICMHNHPSGDVTPSKDDIMFTKALVEIGRMQNIPILDHIIVGEDKYYSFQNEGLIDL